MYKSNKYIFIIRIDKVHLKCDCINGSFVRGIREPISSSFSLDKSPGHKMYKGPRIKVFKRIINSVLPQITFYIEDDDHQPVDFKGETI